MKKNAFTMIELVFVIVILGILASVAIPRLAVTRTDAQIATGQANVSAIRIAIINERQSRLFRGDPSFITHLAMDTGGIFGGVLPYPLTGDDWAVTTAGTTYTYTVGGVVNTFTYDEDDGTLVCSDGDYCARLAP